VDEANVMENLASAALLADELPLSVIQLDDGYQAAWGDWSIRNDRFPHSLQWLADRIRGSGFRPGLWLAPLVVERTSLMAHDHPDWLLRDATGRSVKAGLVSDFIGRALDTTHPGVEAYLADLAETAVKGWGYEYLKLDFMYAAALQGRRYNPQMTRAQALRHAYRIIREAVGPDTYLVACGTPLGPAAGLVDAVRIGPDTAPTWAPRVWGVRRLFRDNPSLPSLRNALRNTACRAWTHGRWWANDPDVLIMRDAGSDLTDDEVLSQVTMAGLSGGLVLLSDDLDTISPERRALVSTLVPPLLDGMDVLDLFEQEMPEVLLVPVARAWGRWRLVALFNWSDAPVERELPETVTLNERKAYHVVDFWEQRYLLLGPGALRPVLHLAPHGVVLLGLRSIQPDPHLVATTFHISQGGEVTRWKLGENELSLTMDIGRFARGSLWLSLPARPRVVALDGEPLPEKSVRAVASGIWSITCRINRVGTLLIQW
jgi:alpha-galactosidase